MGNDKISGNDAIDAALRLDGNPENVREYYDGWAQNYETDVGAQEYSGPIMGVKILQNHQPPGELNLLDAGCGTGLVGVELERAGYGKCDGFDLSAAMAERAAATGCYHDVRGEIDIMRAADIYLLDRYDAVLSIGVFTLGHVPPQALEVLLRLVRPGGLLLVSTRTHYYEKSEYRGIVDDLLRAGRMQLLELLKDAPYNVDGDAHYWVFKKSA